MSAMHTSRPFASLTRHDHDSDEASLSLHACERRRRPRMKNDGIAMAVFSGGTAAGKLTPIRLTDTSVMGLGAISPVAVEPGCNYSLLHESGCNPRQVGTVVRCEPDGDLFRLGLRGRCVAPAA